MSRLRRLIDPDPICRALELSDEAFVSSYLPAGWSSWTHPCTEVSYELQFGRADRLGDKIVDTCLSLLERTIGYYYKARTPGWCAEDKREEMRLKEMRYFIVLRPDREPEDEDEKTLTWEGTREGTLEAARVCGFMSVMPLWKEGEPTLYCYQLHLDESLRGAGLGRHLLELTLATAQRIKHVTRVTLACFVANAHAMRFYAGMGFNPAEYSPGRRVLRDGRVVESDYVILTRVVGEIEDEFGSESRDGA